MASIFKKSVVKDKVEKLVVPNFDKKVAIIQAWYDSYLSGTLHLKNERQCEQEFINDIFKEILGYTGFPTQPHTIIPQISSDTSAQRPDAGLGYFDGQKKRVFAVVEIKDVNTALDQSQRREGNLSPIQQAFKYKPQFKDCRFVIATNLYEIRLFQDNQIDYEIFTLKSLANPANDHFELKRFILLLNEDNFVSRRGKSKTEDLLAEIRVEQEKITKEFYSEYSDLRLKLMRDIWKNNKEYRNINLVADKAQKILDRIVFTCFCEDTGLLPDNTLLSVYKHAETSVSSFWDSLKGFFNAVDSGSEKLGIPNGYNGGLFHKDDELDVLRISDEACKSLSRIGQYDFENELTVNILGHVFEQSITDLEEIKKKVEPDEESQKSKRKKDGIFYTPEYIVDYIVQNSLGRYLRENEERIFNEFKLDHAKTDKSYRERELKALQAYQDFLHDVKVVDPACGSGAFLVKVFDYLLEENRRIGKRIGSLFDQDEIFREILKNNIFGVDLNEESVRITQLSLWLKTAQKGKKLTYLDKNIRCGNSLIDDPNIAGTKAFEWNDKFNDVFEAGGFDIVVGNPPYVDSETMVKTDPKQREALSKKYVSATGNWDLFVPFIELGMNILKTNGYTSFINPNKILSADYASSIRTLIQNKYKLSEIAYLGTEHIFADADVYPVINIFQKFRGGYTVFKNGLSGDPITVSSQTINSDNWSPYLHKNSWILGKLKTANLLSDIAKINSSATVSEAYELKDLIVNYGEFKIVNTGTIDKFCTLWGLSEMNYLGKSYLQPYSNQTGYLLKKKWVKSPKIIIAGMAKEIEAFGDIQGKFIGSKSTTIITTKEPNELLFILSILNSKITSIIFEINNFTQSMSGGYMNINQRNLSKIKIPNVSSAEKDNLAQLAMNIILLNDEILRMKIQFKSLLLSDFPNLYQSKSFKDFDLLDFSSFLKILRIKPTLIEKESLIQLFNKYSAEVAEKKMMCKKLSDTIDTKVAFLFGLSIPDLEIIYSTSV